MSAPQGSDPQKKKAVTIRQVAELAGVSVATVSRALAGSDLVSSELAMRVKNAARTLGYKPNQIARSFRTKKTRIVGLVISDIENPFFTSVVRGVEKVLRDAGYSLLLTDSNEDEKIEQEHLQNLSAEGVAGVILTPSSKDARMYDDFAESGMVLVAIDRVPRNLKADRVTVNNTDGVTAAVNHLASLGHKKIGFITGLPNISTASERQLGYERGMKALHLPVQPYWIQQGNFRRDGGYQAMMNILNLKDRPTAIISGNNLMTLGALSALYECKTKIPAEMSVIGYDDMVWADALNPPLSVIAQPSLELGRVAAQLLLDRLQDTNRSFRHIMLDTHLIIRASCGPLHGSASPRISA